MITAILWGRLGNNMFQYALARSVAERTGYNFWINAEGWRGNELFECDFGVKDGEVQQIFNDRQNQPFMPEVFDVTDFTEFRGFFQTDKYFNREDVKKWFKIKHNQEAEDFLKQYPRDEYCYINVRGGDQKTFILTLPQEYYDRAVSLMRCVKPDMKFVVITDETDFAKGYFPDFPVYSNSKETDFCVLHYTKYVISAISTFCWWAAYLQDDNVVVAPHSWFNYNVRKGNFAPQDINTSKFIWI